MYGPLRASTAKLSLGAVLSLLCGCGPVADTGFVSDHNLCAGQQWKLASAATTQTATFSALTSAATMAAQKITGEGDEAIYWGLALNLKAAKRVEPYLKAFEVVEENETSTGTVLMPDGARGLARARGDPQKKINKTFRWTAFDFSRPLELKEETDYWFILFSGEKFEADLTWSLADGNGFAQVKEGMWDLSKTNEAHAELLTCKKH